MLSCTRRSASASAAVRWGDAAGRQGVDEQRGDNSAGNSAGNSRITERVTGAQQNANQSESDSEEEVSKKGSGLRPAAMPPAAAASAQHAMVLPVVGLDGVDADAEKLPLEESPQERLNRAAYAESRMIVGRLLPEMPARKVGELIGWGNKHLGRGPAGMVQVLRDVEREASLGAIQGDMERAIRGFVHKRGRPSGARPGEKATYGTLIREMVEAGEMVSVVVDDEWRDLGGGSRYA